MPIVERLITIRQQQDQLYQLSQMDRATLICSEYAEILSTASLGDSTATDGMCDVRVI